jgi:pyruvate dehydrogenase E2 component (dihydrolipoyllysine-residue acetyltransferase)
MTQVMMPKLSDTMEEGKLLRWLKRAGDRVEVGEILAEVETDKADMELEASVGGVLSELRLAEGDSAAVGAVIAVIEDRAPAAGVAPETTPEGARANRASSPAPAPGGASQAAAARISEVAPALGDDRGKPASDGPSRPGAESVREATMPETSSSAEELAGSVRSGAPTKPEAPTKPGAPPGVVRVRPPKIARPTPPSATADAPLRIRRVPLSRMRASIARRMVESKREAPHFYLSAVVAMSDAVHLRDMLRRTAGEGRTVTFNHMVLKACADALAVVPEMNARFAGDAIEIVEDVNLGIATAVDDGLIVPVIHGADRLSLLELAVRARALAERAGTSSFTGADLSGATFSVSNLGMYGVESFAAVINPPQAGILAVGAVEPRPVVREGQVTIGHTMSLTLSCDHRVVDGVQGARFLAEVRRRLESPLSLVVGEAPS